MATVASTIKMFDSMSGPLKNITSSMNLMVSTMQRMQDVTNRNTNIDKTLKVAKQQIASAESEIARQIEQANAAQNKFNQSVKNGESRTKNLLSTMKGMAATYLSIQGLKAIGGSTLGAAMQQQQMVDTFASRTGSAQMGEGIYNALTKQALKFGQDVNASLISGMSFMSATANSGQLEQLNNLAMRLSKLNPAEGMEGAAFSLKELLSGDYTSIAERFNISRSMLKDSEARIAGMNGDIEGFIKGMDKMLNQQNMTQEAFEKMLDSPAAKWQAAIDRFKYNLAGAGSAGMTSFTPLIDMLNNFVQSNSFNSMMNGIGLAIDLVVRSVSGLVQGIQWLGQLFSSLGFVYPLIVSIASGFLMYTGAVKAVTLATNIAKVAQIAFNAVMAANPIGLVIVAIGALILGLATLIATVEPVREGFAKAFEFMGDVVSKFVKWSLEGLESFINGFVKAVNALLDGVNKVINAVGKFIGLESEVNLHLNTVDFSKFSNKLSSGVEKAFDNAAAFTRDFTAENIKKMGAQMLGYKGNSGFTSSLQDGGAAAAAAKMSMQEIDSIGKVGEVGKINDTVDIGREDLKLMRELAEMKSIQNFVTLTPTVSVNGGMHVRKESDIDEIASLLEAKLSEEIAANAAGVYP